MRAVTGTVTSSKPISVSKAAAILARFAAADIGARREVAAFLKRASNAFEDLVQIHRELRHSHKRAEVEIKQEVVEDREEEGEAAEERRKRKKRKKKDREDGSSRVGDNGNLTEVDGDHGERNVEERKKSKKKSPDEERRDFEKNNEVLKAKVKVEMEEVEEARSEDWRKKKKKEKKRKHLNVEEAEGGVENGSERRERNKKKRKT